MKVNLSKLTNPVLGTLAEQVISVSARPAYAVVKNNPLLKTVEEEYTSYFTVFGRPGYSGMGASVESADARVDADFNGFKYILKGYARMSGQPLAADAEVLYALIRRYGVDLYLRSYSNQTENIDKLIEELEKTEHADRLAALGLTSVFDELVAAQQAFKSIYLEQSEANASLRVTPSASSLRKRLENSIRNYLQFVHAMKDVDGWSLLYAELNELAKAARNSKQSRASTPAL